MNNPTHTRFRIRQSATPIRGGLPFTVFDSATGKGTRQQPGNATCRVHEGTLPPPPSPTLDGTRAARARGWAADAIARARWLAHEAKRGDAWPTLEGAFARARLADVFALLADGHAQAAENLRRTLQPPPGTTTTPGPSVDRSRPPRRVLGHADARHGAVAPSTP